MSSTGRPMASDRRAGGQHPTHVVSAFEAFYIPGLEAADIARWSTVHSTHATTPSSEGITPPSGSAPERERVSDAAYPIRYPILTPDAIRRLTTRLCRARAKVLDKMPAREIAERVGTVAQRLGRRGDRLRGSARDALVATTGYTAPMIDLALDHMAVDWAPETLVSLIDSEFGDAQALDRWPPMESESRAHGPSSTTTSRSRAYGPRLAFNVFAGNVPGVALTATIRCLLVKAAVLAKTGRDEPALVPIFARALHELEPEIASCIAVSYWPGAAPADDPHEHGGRAMTDAALAAADLVVVYGGQEAVEQLTARANAGTPVITHGPRVSIGLVAREALRSEDAARAAADAAALATAIFDQHGCVSPHALYVEHDGAVDVARFAGMLAEAFERLARDLPRRRLSPAEAAVIHDLRASLEFRDPDGATVRMIAGPDIAFTILLESNPEFKPSCLNRTLRVMPVASLEQVHEHLSPLDGLLQTVAFAGDTTRLDALTHELSALGACRFTSFERMPWPPADWAHDGRGPLTELVRFANIER